MQAFPASARVEIYYSVVARYLGKVVHHLSTYVDGVEFDRERIPDVLLKAAPQRLPG